MFETEPLGGPKGQKPYINAVLLIDGRRLARIFPAEKEALILLEKFLSLEKKYGRERKSEKIRWGPRSLDIDLLAWGNLQVKSNKLTIPHPRLIERSFVIVPLAAAISSEDNPPKKIFQKDWPESEK